MVQLKVRLLSHHSRRCRGESRLTRPPSPWSARLARRGRAQTHAIQRDAYAAAPSLLCAAAFPSWWKEQGR